MRVLATLCLILLVICVNADAQVQVEREGDENPVMSVAKSTFWGALGGLVLGGAVALVAEEDEGDIIKWFVVGGTFAGFGYGIYHVSTRPQPPSALLEIEDGGLALNFPSVTLQSNSLEGDRKLLGRVTFVSCAF